ncbi:unnamed protein product, partial [Amoebophrya sp. A120]
AAEGLESCPLCTPNTTRYLDLLNVNTIRTDHFFFRLVYQETCYVIKIILAVRVRHRL